MVRRSLLSSTPGWARTWSLPGLLAGISIALVSSPTPAPAATCPNEQLRSESNTNPATGTPYSGGLPDCRAYEMLSPEYKQSHDVTPVNNSGIAVATDGAAAGFPSEGAFSGPENDIGGFEVLNYYTSRRGALSWETLSAFPPVTLISSPNKRGLSSDFSPDLRSEQVNCGASALGKNGDISPRVVCARREAGGSWVHTPFYLSPENTRVGTANYMGASSDLSRVFIQPEAALLPGDTTTEGAGIYEVAGVGTETPKLRLVNVEGPFESESELAIHRPSAQEGPALGDRRVTPKIGGTDYHAVSADGEIVFFTANPPGNEAATIYARVEGGRPSAHTVVVSGQAVGTGSAPTECDSTCQSSAAKKVGQPGAAIYQGASADGSKVFFTTSQKLVNEDANEATDLYEYELATNRLVLVTPGKEAQGAQVVRISSDGSHVYFVEIGALATKKPEQNENTWRNANGEVEHEKASETGENLYGYDTDNEELRFVAATGANRSGVKESSDVERYAQTTPDGRYLVFSSPGQFAGDTNSAAVEAAYRYDFDTGELTWISQASPGLKTERESKQLTANPNEGKGAVIAPVPGTEDGAEADIEDWNRAVTGCPKGVSETEQVQCPEGQYDGEYVIFTTAEKLQADDVNSAPDVYEWHDGTVAMISDGHDTQTESGTLIGASGMSASGSDIDFFTHTALVGQDKDVLEDLYDARVNGGFPAPPVEPACSGEQCQGNPSPPPSYALAPSSLVAAGGNLAVAAGSVASVKVAKPKPLTRAQLLAKALKACTTKPHNKRAACEALARKRYGSKAKAKARKKPARARVKKSARGGR
jgi:hypothetical protein